MWVKTYLGIFNFYDNTVVYDKNRKIKKKDLITFLIKLKYDLSDDLLKVLLSYNSRVSVSLVITSVRTSLSQRFVLENLGPDSIARDAFINNHVTDFAYQLYNPDPENRRAIIYVDGTYLKIPKNSNFFRFLYLIFKLISMTNNSTISEELG
jgi:hypothetical protein